MPLDNRYRYLRESFRNLEALYLSIRRMIDRMLVVTKANGRYTVYRCGASFAGRQQLMVNIRIQAKPLPGR